MNIFTNEFVEKVLETLNSECPEGTGQRITRTDLAKKLELEKPYEPVLGLLIKDNDDFSDWGNFKGVGGGIGRKGESPAKKSNGSSGPAVPQEFLDKLSATLERLCTYESNPVPRRVVASEMGQEGGKEEAMISAALKMDNFKDKYDVKRGKSGGIVLREEEEETPEIQDTPTYDTNEDEDIDMDVADDLSAAFVDDEDEDSDYEQAI